MNKNKKKKTKHGIQYRRTCDSVVILLSDSNDTPSRRHQETKHSLEYNNIIYINMVSYIL